MNHDYLEDVETIILDRLANRCKHCVKAKECQDNWLEHECEYYQEIESELSL